MDRDSGIRRPGWRPIAVLTIAVITTISSVPAHTSKRDPRELLPLTAIVLQVLLALADRDKHGYAIIKEVRRRTDGEVELGASSLYAVLKRLLSDALVEETDERPDPALDDERRRYYRLAPFGREVAVAELHRLDSVLHQARVKRLLPAARRA
jgi:DNA-binding PadR family transcriptional regulator